MTPCRPRAVAAVQVRAPLAAMVPMMREAIEAAAFVAVMMLAVLFPYLIGGQ